jgi:hypothetical protein
MGKFAARLGRGCSSVGVLDRLPAMPAPSEWDGFFNRRKSDRVLRGPPRGSGPHPRGPARGNVEGYHF